MSLRDTDLNLLVILEVVLKEGSITRAARRLNITQPAVSQALARCRQVFGDALLVRDGAGMTPTPRALALAPRLREALHGVEALLRPDRFDPFATQEDFVIVAGDVTELVILPPLIAEVARAAPHSRLIIRSVEARGIDHDVDLAIVGGELPRGPFCVRDLYEEHFVVLARRGHPHMRDGITAEEFARLPQALVSPTGQGLSGPVDEALERHGLRRHIALSVTRFVTLPHILAGSDLISAVPSRFAARAEVQALCQAWPLPFESPRATMRLLWHRARDADPAHKWLRELI